jgi:hypothetical protein
MRIAIFVLAATLGLAGCRDEVKNTCRANSLQDLPWLQKIIDEDRSSREKAEAVRYTYRGETVILVDLCSGCPDGAVLVYNCRGEKICTFGTIAGLDTCPDFFSVAEREEVLWSR